MPEATAAWLTDAERVRWLAFRRPEDRARFLGAHALGRIVVGARLGWDAPDIELRQVCRRCGGPHGQPEVGGAEVSLSLAHAGGLVAAAVADAPVGIDIEPLDAPPAALAAVRAVALSAVEQAEHDGVGEGERPAWLLRRWVAKEAVAKALGVGLVGDPATVGAAGHQVVELALDPGYAAALAVRGADPPAVVLTRVDWADINRALAGPGSTTSGRTSHRAVARPPRPPAT